MKGITVSILKELVDHEVAKGNGNKVVLLSSDDEGNGFHTLYYGFISKQEDINTYHNYGLFHDFNDPNTVVLLG